MKVIKWVCHGCDQGGDAVPCRLEITDGVRPRFCPLDQSVQVWVVGASE